MLQSASRPPDFQCIAVRSGLMFSFETDQYPARVVGWCESDLRLTETGTHYGLVQTGSAVLSCESGEFRLQSGMYFAIPGTVSLTGNGMGFVVSNTSYKGIFQIGGPLERRGRLRYIDGCTDSLLIAPPLRGDPCFNLLHIPANTHQTPHTHPSLRVGMVVDGTGFCRTNTGEVPLVPGHVFAIQAGGLHSFHTAEQPMRIVAWHPDSDFGPTHDHHPMLNKTLVGGNAVNAAGGTG